MSTKPSLSSIKKKVIELLKNMSLEEKIAQLQAYYVYDLQTDAVLDPKKVSRKLKHGIGQISRIAGASALYPVEAAKLHNQIQKFLVQKTRLGIPAINHEECCAGLMSAGCSVYPEMIGLASTFKPAHAEQMTGMIRKQMRAIGAHEGLAPVLDVSRDSRWGRVEETFGEDPTLVSQFGMAYVRGLQGEDLREGVLATGKHFVGHSFSQGGLNCGPVHIGWHDLWDVYLAPFQAVIRDARIGAMMNAYPEVDGEVVAASRRFLTDLLRKTLGFDGVVVSDYEAIPMIHNYHFNAPDKASAAAWALTAGIDVELPSVNCYGDELLKALKEGKVSMETIDLAVSRHLQKKYELGLFDNPYVNENEVLAVFETDANRALAYEIACDSMVLLKNDGILPLSKETRKIAVIGPNADSARNMMGDYSFAAFCELMSELPPDDSAFLSQTKESLEIPTVKVPTILNGIKNAVSSKTTVMYAKGCDINSSDTRGFGEAQKAAKSADVVLMVMGDRSGLAHACTTGEFRDTSDLRLPGVQEELVKTILATGKPVVLVLVNGRPRAIGDLIEKSKAILEAWVPGEEGAHALASILFGDKNPGGKLPISIPRSAGQVPIFYNHKISGMRSNIWGDYVNEPVAPLYPFGYGLSYTTFAYDALKISKKTAAAGEIVDVSLTVTNTGKVPGDEVVQLYTRDEYASMPRPIKELRGFARISLNPGESRKVIFHLPVNQMAFYNIDFKLVVEPGRIQVAVGSSSADLRLMGEFNISGSEAQQVKDRVFECPVEIK